MVLVEVCGIREHYRYKLKTKNCMKCQAFNFELQKTPCAVFLEQYVTCKKSMYSLRGEQRLGME